MLVRGLLTLGAAGVESASEEAGEVRQGHYLSLGGAISEAPFILYYMVVTNLGIRQEP